MNTKQRRIVILGVILIALMAIFPPWRGTRVGGFFERDRTVAIGYAPVFNPPSLPDAEIDGTRLSLQIAAIVFLSVCGFVLLKNRE